MEMIHSKLKNPIFVNHSNKSMEQRTPSIKFQKRTLQVQTSLPKSLETLIEKLLCFRCSCSFTIEAALALSLFIMAGTVLIVPTLILHRHQKISLVLEQHVERLAKYKYLEKSQELSDKIGLNPDLIGDLELVMSHAALRDKLHMPGMQLVDLYSDTKLNEENIQFVVNYDAIMPFSILGLHSLPQQVTASRRAWIGAPGYRWGDPISDGSPEDPLVYVAYDQDPGNVYHTSLSCSYFTHAVISIPSENRGSDPGKIRFQGRTLHACAICRPTLNGEIYCTENGSSFHSDPDCRSMESKPQSMPLSKAKAQGRHPCVRCGAG